jgi:Domain of Unknown Function with PDB structure (DUF3861)
MPSFYAITVQPTDASGTPNMVEPLTFRVSNHDDLLAILRRVQANEAVPPAEAAEFVIGLKLFLEVMIRHRKDALFAGLWPHMGEFMKRLKAVYPKAVQN